MNSYKSDSYLHRHILARINDFLSFQRLKSPRGSNDLSGILRQIPYPHHVRGFFISNHYFSNILPCSDRIKANPRLFYYNPRIHTILEQTQNQNI